MKLLFKILLMINIEILILKLLFINSCVIIIYCQLLIFKFTAPLKIYVYLYPNQNSLYFFFILIKKLISFKICFFNYLVIIKNRYFDIFVVLKNFN